MGRLEDGLGRAHVDFETVSTVSTRVTVTVRYVVTNTQMVGMSSPTTRTLSFSTGQQGSSDDGSLTCHPTGALEQAMLDSLTDDRGGTPSGPRDMR